MNIAAKHKIALWYWGAGMCFLNEYIECIHKGQKRKKTQNAKGNNT